MGPIGTRSGRGREAVGRDAGGRRSGGTRATSCEPPGGPIDLVNVHLFRIAMFKGVQATRSNSYTAVGPQPCASCNYRYYHHLRGTTRYNEVQRGQRKDP